MTEGCFLNHNSSDLRGSEIILSPVYDRVHLLYFGFLVYSILPESLFAELLEQTLTMVLKHFCL